MSEEGEFKRRMNALGKETKDMGLSEVTTLELSAIRHMFDLMVDEAKKDFYDLLNSETETNYSERLRFRELVKKWFGEVNV